MTVSLGTPVWATTPNGNNATFSIAATITISAGDHILVLGTCTTNSSPVLSVSGSGLTYIQIGTTVVDSGTHTQTAQWYVVNPGAGTYTITVSCSGTPASPYPGIMVVAVKGAALTSPLVASGPDQFQTAPGTGADVITSGAAQTPASYPCLVVGFCTDDDTNGIPAAGTGFTSIGTGWQWEIATAGSRLFSKRITSGTARATATDSVNGGADHYITNMAAFLELSSVSVPDSMFFGSGSVG